MSCITFKIHQRFPVVTWSFTCLIPPPRGCLYLDGYTYMYLPLEYFIYTVHITLRRGLTDRQLILPLELFGMKSWYQ